MENNPHFSELLRILSAHKVEFLIVGGYAVMKYNFRVKGKTQGPSGSPLGGHPSG